MVIFDDMVPAEHMTSPIVVIDRDEMVDLVKRWGPLPIHSGSGVVTSQAGTHRQRLTCLRPLVMVTNNISYREGVIMHHELRTDIEIAAPIETVWEMLTDLAAYPNWNPFIVSADGRANVGERLANRMQPPGGKGITFKPTVTVVEAPVAFEWLGRLGLPGIFDGRHRFDLAPSENGGTLMTQSEQFSGILVRFVRTSLDTQTLAGFEAMNAALKARAEAIVGSSS